MKRIKSISKKVNIYISVFVLLVSAVFSFPMDAKAAKKRVTFTAGENADALWTSPRSSYTNPNFVQVQPGVSPSASMISNEPFSLNLQDSNFTFALADGLDPIPAGSDVYFDLVLSFNTPSSAIEYRNLEYSIDSPTLSSNSLICDVSFPNVYTLRMHYYGYLRPSVNTSVISGSLGSYLYNAKDGARVNITFESCYAYYEVEETEKDVLEDIRDNTTETNDKLDNLTDGFQNDGMDSSKDELNSSLAGIDNAENSLFNPAKDHLGSYEFVDINSFQGLATGVTFVSTFLQSFYVSSGGLDGLGIITAVGFSVLLVSVVIGFFRYYKK